MRFRELAYPFGRCLIVSPPNETNTRRIHPNVLYLFLGLLEKGTRLKMFFMEKSSSLQLYPNEMEMTGEKLDLKLWRDPPEKVTYKVKISQNQHVQGDLCITVRSTQLTNPTTTAFRTKYWSSLTKRLAASHLCWRGNQVSCATESSMCHQPKQRKSTNISCSSTSTM